MRRIHFVSGILLTIFIALHLFNHIYSIFGIEEHIHMMDKLRLFYRPIGIETILVLALSIQIITGIKLFFTKRKTASGFFEKLQIWSGLYLALFFVFHTSAVFIGRWFLELDTNFYFGAAGLNTFPFYLFFVPYYGMAILSFFGHIAAIHAQKMKSSLLGITPAQQSYIILAIGVLVTLTIFYGLTNGFKGIELPAAYDVMIGK